MKFIVPNVIATVSKDQRLIIWKIDLDKEKVILIYLFFIFSINYLFIIKKFPVKVHFLNVSDVSSMDLIKLNE